MNFAQTERPEDYNFYQKLVHFVATRDDLTIIARLSIDRVIDSNR